MQGNEMTVLSPFIGTIPLKSDTIMAINGVKDIKKNSNN
jgi:hypothetical protein